MTFELRQPIALPNEFTLIVDADDRQSTCSGSLATYTCEPSDNLFVIVWGDSEVTSISVLNYTPKTVHLHLESSGALLLDETATDIHYEATPLGSCGPVCDTADIQI